MSFKKILIIVLLLISIGAIATFYFVISAPRRNPDSIGTKMGNTSATNTGLGVSQYAPTSTAVATDTPCRGLACQTPISTWQTYIDSDNCYNLLHPQSFTVNAASDGPVTLETASTTSTDGISLTILKNDLPPSSTIESFIQTENAALTADSTSTSPDELTSSPYMPTHIGNFIFSQNIIIPGNSNATNFIAPAQTSSSYYSVVVANMNQDPLIVTAILQSFTPQICSFTSNTTSSTNSSSP